MASSLLRGAAAGFLSLGLTAVAALGDAGPKSFVRPTAPSARRPTATKPTTTKPTTPAKPTAPGIVKPAVPTPPAPTTGGVPIPMPPQPKRDDTVEAAPKPAIPHPTVAGEVQAPPSAAPVPESPPAATQTLPNRATPAATAPTAEVAPDAEGRYTLRYLFSNGETVRWRVEHRAKIVTTVGVSSELGVQGTTQTAESTTISQKVWRVVETLPSGESRFVHSVDAIDMRQKLTGRQEITYNSETDKGVPPIFAEAAKQIGVPLSEVTIDPRGNVVKREDKQARPEGAAANTITLVLPDRPLAVGESWTQPFDLQATDSHGATKPIKARHKLTLEKVEQGVATIRNETQILSPISDPAVEAQVVQHEQSGTVTFDLRRGRIVAQSSAMSRDVFGFQGPESKLEYATEFRETLLDGEVATMVEAPAADGANPLR